MIFVYITCRDKEEAIRISKTLVIEKLAGCVNIIEKMTSIYEWEGQLEVSEEVVIIAKTNESLFTEITSRVKEIHSYKVPCILSIAIKDGNEDYIKWLESGIKLI
ncbi:MAG: divalent-cation tolerance protein CutA [Leptospiraceae bacterium]|nr:divalent-cation tolerance protein CutA [Leptospiraceae bacterium]